MISRRTHERLLAEHQIQAKATIDEIKSAVAKALLDAETLVAKREAEMAAMLEKADARVLRAETELAIERREGTRAIRHFASMWLRHQRSMPLPKTAEEKKEAKAEAKEKDDQPPILTDVQLAMRDANRIEAARFGKTQEEADADFEREFLNQMMEE